MLISEIYCSRQGEGLLTGTPSVFVRTSGCNLRCEFCDTPFASWQPEGNAATVEEILQQSIEHAQLFADDVKHVVITGGEPMLPREINELCEKISAAGFHITIETAGTIDRMLNCNLMSISPKLSNSDPTLERAGEWRKKHQSTRHRPDIVRSLVGRYEYQLKFVVDSPDDLEEIIDYLSDVDSLISSSDSPKPLIDRKRVLLMPQGIAMDELNKRAQWLVPLCEKHGFTYCPRRHIEWYGNKRGT
jgi:7-carboxy-7-deazaguanine synthase